MPGASPKIKVLLVGSGAREHAMGWKLCQSPGLSELFVSPGNPAWPEVKAGKWKQCDSKTNEGLAAEAKGKGISLLVVGPDNALEAGIVDDFQKQGILCFGPTRAAARIESSKTFSKELMLAAGVPTARFKSFSKLDEANRFIEAASDFAGWVVKADGLALGKGVRVCHDVAEAKLAAGDLIKLSGKVLIEEFLDGEEISWLAICDGKRASLFESARDYKRIGTGNQGENTGGMGAYSPVPGFGVEWADRLEKEVFQPVLDELRRQNTPLSAFFMQG